MSDAGVPTEALQLPPEKVRLHHETLTVGSPLEDEEAVAEKYGFTGVSLATKVEIPVEKSLGDSKEPGDGTRVYYLFQAGEKGTRDLLYQVANFPKTYEPPEDDLHMKHGDVTFISEESLEALMAYREAHPDHFNLTDWEALPDGGVPFSKGTNGEGIIGRDSLDSPLVSKLAEHDGGGHASRRHLKIEIPGEGSDEGKVVLTDLSKNGTRVEARPGYRKVPAPQNPIAS